MFRLPSNNTISNVAPSLSLESLVQRTRVLVIDDVESEFPFAILRKFGYSIDHWQDVVDLRKLETGFYDIIILDIGGVGSELDAEQEGIGVLRHIKQVNPSQIVIAHSGQSYDTEKIPFFRLADDYVPKPTNAMAWKEILDETVRSSLNAVRYWNSLRDMLISKGISDRKIRKLEKRIISASSSDDEMSSKIVNTTLGTIDNVATVASVTGKIISLVLT